MPKRQLKLTPDDKLWAKSVKERDGMKCVICSSTERLNAHHIIPREIHDTKQWVENGLSLCPKHHFFSRNISAHNNPLALIYWMAENRPGQLEKILNKLKELDLKDD